MESVLEEIESGTEESTKTALANFNEKNKANFNLGESTPTRKKFCQALLDNLSSNLPSSWSLRTKALALNALRIFAREREGTDRLTCTEGLRPIVELAELSEAHCNESCFTSGDKVLDSKVEALVEAVKCLCNVVLTNHYLASTCATLGCLKALALRLSLCRSAELSHDVLFFDLRLLFLITACGPEERVTFRDQCNGIPILINLTDSIVFSHEPDSTHTQHQPASSLSTVSTDESSKQSEAGATKIETSKQLEVGTPTQSELEMGTSKQSKAETLDGSKTDVLETKPSEPSTQGAEIESEASGSFSDVHSKGGRSKFSSCLPPVRDSVYCLTSPLDDKQFALISEALKILFNQTLHWRDDADYDDEELQLFRHLTHLIRILVVSVPLHQSKASMETISHCIEVLVNIPLQCAFAMLSPPHVRVMPTLRRSFPALYPPQPEPEGACVSPSLSLASGANGEKEGELYSVDLDRVFDDWNMAAIVSMLNFLDARLTLQVQRHSVSPVLSALRILSKGHRSIRRLLRAEILPPLREIKQRPEEGESLKSKVVQLMIAGSHGAEEITAEFLFVLCKESASRLIKHTGYGNAAGLLLAHGLLGGGRSEGEADYSSDSELSDTEEYKQAQPHIDPVTGGPSKKEEASPLEGMTEEEKEREAEKLEELFRKLDRHGIIKVMPLDKQQQPIKTEEPSSSSDDDLD